MKNNVAVYEGIKTLDGTKEYPVDTVREQFINSDDTLETIALELNLPISIVQSHARQGMQSWYEMKNNHLAERLKYFMNLNVDNLVESHSVLEEGHWLTLAQIKGQQFFLKKYLEQYGHLFRVDEDGEISKDPYGAPIPMPLPNTPKHFMALEGFLKLKEGTKAALQQVQAVNEERRKPTVMDVEATGLFDEKE
jgi:hypothetical protein